MHPHNADRATQVTLRVLVDQSGYDLLNLGDVAMLQACVQRLRALRPDADIAVLCHDPDLLATYCPDTLAVPVSRRRAGSTRRLAGVAAQGWKIVGPVAVRRRRRRVDAVSPPTGWRDAIQWADVVVSSGGGFLTDAWWWHGAGVLSVLGAAQRLGKPTAMFGQGLGPLRHVGLRRQAARVLPRLTLLALRGAATGEPLAHELGVASSALVVTGDDGLELVDFDNEPDPGTAVGLNVRVAAYSAVDDEVARIVGEEVARFVTLRASSTVVLPVALFAGASDARATERMLAGRLTQSVDLSPDVRDPAGLVAAVARCRIVVTGSYHAAVFALASGVPVIGLSRSGYYDAKFADLAGLFPGAVSVVRLADRQTGDALRAAMEAAWDVGPEQRAATRARAAQQKESGRAAYARFLERAGWLSRC